MSRNHAKNSTRWLATVTLTLAVCGFCSAPLAGLADEQTGHLADARDSGLSADQTLRLEPTQDTLGDFTARYSIVRFWRGVDTALVGGATQPTNLLMGGEATVTRKGEWICYQVKEETPLPSGGMAPSVDSATRVFFIRNGRLFASIQRGVYYENPGQEAILENGLVPFTTDLSYAWDGERLLSQGEQATQRLDAAILDNVTTSPERVRRTLVNPVEMPGVGKTYRMTTIQERETATSRLSSVVTGFKARFPDGSTFMVPLREQEVTRYVDSMAAGISLNIYTSAPRDGSDHTFDSVSEYEDVYGSPELRDQMFLLGQEKLELLSFRAAAVADRATPEDFVDLVQFVTTNAQGQLRPALVMEEDSAGEEVARRTLELDPVSLMWEEVAE